MVAGREVEIVGGLKNALERGTDIMKAQQSFVNAGYSVGEVAAAAQMVAQGGVPAAQPAAATPQTTPPRPGSLQTAPVAAQPTAPVAGQGAQQAGAQFPGTPPKKSKGWIWALSIIGLIIAIGAAVLWLYWDQLF